MGEIGPRLSSTSCVRVSSTSCVRVSRCVRLSDDPRPQDVECPGTGEVIGTVAASGASDVDAAVAAAQVAQPRWAAMTSKECAAIMLKWHHLIDENIEELSELLILENGKNKTEAVGDVAKGNETVEWACSMPQLLQGKTLEVSSGVAGFEITHASFWRNTHASLNGHLHGYDTHKTHNTLDGLNSYILTIPTIPTIPTKLTKH